jgi:putative DNA primase/helicase
VEQFLCRFVRFQNDHQRTAVALWIAHVYAIEAAPAAAYLRVTSATEESGKTTLLEVCEVLLRDRALNAISASPASVFRIRDHRGPVALLLDEIDQTLKDRKDDGARDLLALVNGGYRRSAQVLRTTGQNHEGRIFRTWGPAAICGLGNLHPTTESRCIPIVLERKPRGQGERWLPHLYEAEFKAMADALMAWATEETIALLHEARPAIPGELRDRHGESWWGMFSIADLAGEGWGKRARQAALVLHADRDDASTMSLGPLLLAHIQAAFEEAGTDRLSTAALLAALVDNDEGPWARFWADDVRKDGPPRVAGADLAKKLRPFRTSDGGRITSRTIKLPDGTTPKGYHATDFTHAWALYLPASRDDATNATNATPLASTVASVASVALGSEREGDPLCVLCGEPMTRYEGMRDWHPMCGWNEEHSAEVKM